jgi:hypothetical protein
MKYIPKNPNEHKFKPSIPKLQGFNKRQTNKKKKQKLSISIETNKMSIMDILFSGQSIDKLTGYIRLSTFEELMSNCRPKLYGYEYIQYKISTKKPAKHDLEDSELAGGSLLSTLQHTIEVNAEANLRYMSPGFNPRLFTDAFNNYTGHSGNHYPRLGEDDYMLQRPSDIYSFYYQQYLEYTKMTIKFVWHSPLTVIDDMLLPSHTPSITDMRRAYIAPGNVYGYPKTIRYVLTKFANGVDIDKWRHNADIENKRKNMMVIE